MKIHLQKYFRHSSDHSNHIIVSVIVNYIRTCVVYRKYIEQRIQQAKSILSIIHPYVSSPKVRVLGSFRFYFVFSIFTEHFFLVNLILIHISPLHSRVCINLRSKLSILSRVANHIKYW
jgi:hypothetical protein